MRLVGSLPTTPTGKVIANQLLRSATSVGANYRAACRSRSDKDFLARMGIVEEEADESKYWMELLVEGDLVAQEKLASLLQESEELVKMVAASIITVKQRRKKPNEKQ